MVTLHKSGIASLHFFGMLQMDEYLFLTPHTYDVIVTFHSGIPFDFQTYRPFLFYLFSLKIK